ncbi:MAG TPA: hypothetical protein VEG30_03505 [Terriglobales bacterium]|nr:hypothetical protein [Terriglobales bacterium]
MRRRFGILLFAIAWTGFAQTTAELPYQVARYEPVLENNYVDVYRLRLAPHFRTPLFQNVHDVVWVALEDSTPRFVMSSGQKVRQELTAGDARFFHSFSVRSVVNDSSLTVEAVVITLKPRGGATSRCECGGDAESALCGCANAKPMPPLWAVSMGRITLAGTTLDPQQSFQRASVRNDTLIVAITPLELVDVATPGEARRIAVPAGGVTWLEAGRHRLKNSGGREERFLSIEF